MAVLLLMRCSKGTRTSKGTKAIHRCEYLEHFWRAPGLSEFIVRFILCIQRHRWNTRIDKCFNSENTLFAWHTRFSGYATTASSQRHQMYIQSKFHIFHGTSRVQKQRCAGILIHYDQNKIENVLTNGLHICRLCWVSSIHYTNHGQA